MRQYERSGVTVDQCTECRGLFLDRGELEKLFEAEANWGKQQTPPQPSHAPGGYPPPAPHQPSYGGPSHVPPPPPPSHGYPQAPAPAYGQHQQHQGYHGHYKHKRRKGFLDDFFG
jgi:uncharacterized protein